MGLLKLLLACGFLIRGSWNLLLLPYHWLQGHTFITLWNSLTFLGLGLDHILLSGCPGIQA